MQPMATSLQERSVSRCRPCKGTYGYGEWGEIMLIINMVAVRRVLKRHEPCNVSSRRTRTTLQTVRRRPRASHQTIQNSHAPIALLFEHPRRRS